MSERLVPKTVAFTDAASRYFIFAILREVAHAAEKHKPPTDALDKQTQENEADKIALDWFNEHVHADGNPDLKELTMEEIEKARSKNQKLMKEMRVGPGFYD